ncbi:trypsin-like serine protease [candidate division KSB1 bacterium]|nr:trypsin-like serine protease [candidate division KSB1 bacterium]
MKHFMRFVWPIACLMMGLMLGGCKNDSPQEPFSIEMGPLKDITFGTQDDGGHPNVGGMVAEWRTPGQKDLLCSGTLIAPTVFLTASHCTAFLESIGITDVWVTFDPSFTSNSKLYHGTMHTNPNFNQVQSDPGDIAVIILDKPIMNIDPASLPTANLFDRMKAAGTLNGQKFTAVGYGVLQPTIGGGPPSFPFTSLRWVAVSEFNALNNAWLRLSQNDATGDGGTCFGDSGGPNFLGAGANETNIIASLTVTGDAMCLATNVTYRLDTASARDFLEDFVTLP